MRLHQALDNYSDDGHTTYKTNAGALPALTMQLKNIRTGTLEGTFVGSAVNVTR